MLIVKGYNGRSHGAKFVHKAILQVSSPITHVELLDTETGLSYSSEFGIGARRKKVRYSHPDRWTETVILPLDEAAIARVHRREDQWIALRKAGLSHYDIRGAIGCAVTGREEPWNQFCSETVFDVTHEELLLSGVLNHKMHPMKLITTLRIVSGGQNDVHNRGAES